VNPQRGILCNSGSELQSGNFFIIKAKHDAGVTVVSWRIGQVHHRAQHIIPFTLADYGKNGTNGHVKIFQDPCGIRTAVEFR